MKYRVGMSQPQNIYIQTRDQPSKTLDFGIGRMDTPEQAAEIVKLANIGLEYNNDNNDNNGDN